MGFDPFLEPFEAPDLDRFAFKLMDLVDAEVRPLSFLAVLDFDFALVAIRAQLIRLIAA